MTVNTSDIAGPNNPQSLYTEIAKIITSSLEVNEVIDAIMNEVRLYFKPHNWSLLRLDPISNQLFFVVSDGLDKELVQGIHIKLGEGIAGFVAESGKPRIVHDTECDSHFSPHIDKLTGFRTQSIIAVPIKFQNQVLGVIELINTLESNSFTQDDLDILEVIADFSAIALTNSIRYEYMASLAVSDPLTGLYNRARLDKFIRATSESSEQAIGLHRASGDARIIVACIDINNLKSINDNYGHRVGDDILVQTARRIQSCCNDTDFAFRIGGDEFLLVLLNVDAADEVVLLDSLHQALEAHAEPITPGFGFSYGIVAGQRKDLENLMEAADKEMYKNKLRDK